MKLAVALLLPLVAALALAGCASEPALSVAPSSRSAPASAPSSTTHTGSRAAAAAYGATATGNGATAAPTGPSAASASGSAAADAEATSPALSAEAFVSLVRDLSEPDSEFFSDNYTSNETSYLQVAARLRDAVRPGGVYLGVGPEQNFTYIALTRPAFAYLIDIRRDNLLLHLLYKAIFDAARSRAELLALLTARPYDAAGDPGSEGSVAEVLAHAERLPATEADFARIHASLLERIEQGYGFALDDADRRALDRTHRAFAKGGLDLRFKLKEQSFRRYPSLRELLLQSDPDGQERGFLASEADYRFVERMQRENRVIPLVGDFSGDRALPELGRLLTARGETVTSFYVSNVEQYLMVDGVWWKWQRNVAALPTDERSVFIRAYLDQGARHPAQLPGHRTATTLQRIADFKAHTRPYASMLALATDG